MKKLIFALILIAVASQAGVMIGQIETLTPEKISQLRGLPGASMMAFLILGPELPASTAIQNLQPPQLSNEEVNAILRKIHDKYMLLITQNLDRSTLNEAKQEVEKLKQEIANLKQTADAIQLPALKRYFLDLVSIARKKLHETWKNRETGENLDVILDADFTLDPLITIISKSGAPMQTPVMPPPLPPSQVMPVESRARIGTTISYPLPGRKVIPIKPGIPTRPIGPLNPIGHWSTQGR